MFARKNNRTNAGKNQVPRAINEPTTHRFHDWRFNTELPWQLQWDGQSMNIDFMRSVMKSVSRGFDEPSCSKCVVFILSGSKILRYRERCSGTPIKRSSIQRYSRLG